MRLPSEVIVSPDDIVLVFQKPAQRLNLLFKLRNAFLERLVFLASLARVGPSQIASRRGVVVHRSNLALKPKRYQKQGQKGTAVPCIFLILCICLAGCQTQAKVENPRAVWCETNKDIRLPKAAVALLSRDEKEKLAAYRLKGIEWCGWRP